MQGHANILVIDDEQIMREGCSRILSKEGWTVATADTGQKGLEAIQRSLDQFDAILLDLMMPGMSGMEALDRIRNIDSNLLVIVITGYATVESAVEAMKKGAYDFIPKPFTPDQLRIVVRRALERRSLQKEAEFLRSEREKSLHDIATEKSRIKTIIHCMGDGVLVCDRDKYVVLTNPAAIRMLNIPESSLFERPLSESHLPPELSRINDETLSRKEKGYASVSQELTVGETFLRAQIAPVTNDLGEVLGSVTVLEDISYLKELDKMKSEFIAMVAHELRSPIAAVEQQLTVILNRMAGEVTEKQEKMLSRAKERTKGLLTLINDLLDLSKIEAGKMVQYKEPLPLQEPIQRVVDLMRAEAEKKRIDLQFLPSPVTSMIHADRLSMEGIFTNLISNAIKYTPERGKIWITLSEEGGCVKATVSDTGIGIKEEDLSRIFDRFYRVKTSETREIIGTGLGLSIVKSIVEAHLGSISVESEEGKGATFTVLLPKEPISTTCIQKK